ncbi:MAG: leucine-rich repeat domain-containing protein [Oscillospiraceae bacterium]|nr:leucine-rich repeat domain-containing protein [Oscillospiraceae bacterium]
MKNRVLALLLCILMCLSMFPASAFAEGESYYVYFWFTSPLTVNESGYSDYLSVGEAILVDESSDYLIGQVPGSILQGLRSYAESQNLQDHCIVSWTVKETGESFDFANQRVDELAAEDHTLNLLATWGTENDHSYGNWYTTQEATCSAPGSKTHSCYICGTSASEPIPAAHRINPVPVEAEPATCTENGTIAYYVCDDCGTKFHDAAGSEVVTDAVAYAPGHALRYCEAEPATCTEDGTIAHYVCDNCGKWFSDAEGVNELTSIADPCPGHEMTYYPETAATCTEKGNTAYYYCEKCNGYFGDEYGENPLDAASVVTDVNPNAHAWENGVCIREGCGAVCNHENAADGVCQTCGETVINERTLLFSAPSRSRKLTAQDGENNGQTAWELSDSGDTLTILGAIPDYDNEQNLPPWHERRTTIRSIEIKSGVTDIGSYAFSGCEQIANIELPLGMTMIKEGTFRNCKSLSSVTIPKTVKSIGQYAFDGCEALDTIVFSGMVSAWNDLLKDQLGDNNEPLQHVRVVCTNGVIESESNKDSETDGSSGNQGQSNKFSVKVVFDSSLGEAILHIDNTKNSITAGDTQTIDTGTVSLEFIPNEGVSLLEIRTEKNSELPKISTGNELEITGETGDIFHIDATFAELSLEKDTSIQTDPEADALKAALAIETGLDANKIKYQINRVKPIWKNSKNDKIRDLTDTEIASISEITFELTAAADTTADTHVYTIFQYDSKASKFVEIEETDGLSVTTTDFSDYAVFAIPHGLNMSDLNKVEGRPRVNDGEKLNGALTNLVAGMEYKKAADPDSAYTLVTENGIISVDPGIYTISIPETNFTRNIEIKDQVTVKFVKSSGQGFCRVHGNLQLIDDTNTYLVNKNGQITVTFSPEENYWLSEIKVGTSPVGANEIRGEMTFPVANATTITYAFSPDSAKSTITVAFDSTIGNVKVDGVSVAPATGIKVIPGQTTVEFTPKAGMYLHEVKLGATVQTLDNNNRITFATAAGTGYRITAEFSNHVKGAKPTVKKVTTTGTSATKPKALALRAEMAVTMGIDPTQILYSITDVTPVWDDGHGNPTNTLLTEAEILATRGIEFELDPPSDSNVNTYNFFVYHYDSLKKDYEDEAVAIGLDVVTVDFSEFAVFAVPGGPTEADLEKVVARSQINDGVKRKGALLNLLVGMEYKRPDASYYTPVTASGIKELAPGTYTVRLIADTKKTVNLTIKDQYTVTFKKLKGNGSYEVTSSNDKYDDDVYLVDKNGSIAAKFKPDSNWYLFEVNVNDRYIGQENVKANIDIKLEKYVDFTKASTVTYGFSNTSISPKTGDRSEVNLWIAEEIVSLLGMTAITWYLFRRKET